METASPQLNQQPNESIEVAYWHRQEQGAYGTDKGRLFVNTMLDEAALFDLVDSNTALHEHFKAFYVAREAYLRGDLRLPHDETANDTDHLISNFVEREIKARRESLPVEVPFDLAANRLNVIMELAAEKADLITARNQAQRHAQTVMAASALERTVQTLRMQRLREELIKDDGDPLTTLNAVEQLSAQELLHPSPVVKAEAAPEPAAETTGPKFGRIVKELSGRAFDQTEGMPESAEVVHISPQLT